MTVWDRYKGLTYLLLAAVPAIVWHLALGDTCHMWLEGRRVARELSIVEHEPAAGAGVVEPAAEAVEEIHSGKMLEAIMPCVAENGAKVVKYVPYVTENANGININTVELSLSGSYAGLVRIIDHMEKNGSPCVLKSLSFSTTVSRSDPARLIATLILQQLNQTI